MKTRFLFPLAVLLLVAAAHAEPVVADSHITAVTVYGDRAVVTRAATVRIGAAGVTEAAFERLPANLIDASLQVSGRGESAAQLLEVTAKPAFIASAANERVKALQEQLQSLARDDRALVDRTSVLEQQRAYVLKIQTATTTPAKDATLVNTTPEGWSKLLAFSDEQLTRIGGERQTVEVKREELKAKQGAIEEQLNELRGQTGRSFKNVVVRLNAAGAGDLELTVRYAVPGAQWSPAYDARVLSSGHAVQLGYFGLVRQNTGEDWKDVDLTLSTARPSLGGGAPELSPWVVQPREIRPLAEEADTVALSPFSVEKAGGARKNAQAEVLAAAPRARPALVAASASVSDQATSATFHLATPASVPADHAPHKVAIATVPLKAEFNYSTTPKLVPAAFLTAEVANSSDYPLLAGPMNVFLDDTFVATSALRSVMPGEKFDLALGADEGIAVKRKLNNRFTEDTGVITKSRRITYDVTISVQNNRKSPEKIVVLDQVPVSRHEKIVVKVLAPDPKDAKPDAAGVLKWTLTLNPGEKRELPLKFSIEHPADMMVSGLE